MKFTEGAFKEWGYEVARDEFGESIVFESDLKEAASSPVVPKCKILINDRIADNMFQQILTRPQEYSVLATPNLNGDYLADACAAQVGGLGLAPGANIGDDAAVFEAVHDTVRVIDVSKVKPGLVLRVLMNGETEQAVGYFAPPGDEAPVSARRRAAEYPPEDHWRWRLRMAEQIAAQLDPQRFGVQAVYVFGSTKNATAGPGSDIDLLVHLVPGPPDQRRLLDTWLAGWSLCLAEMNFLRTGHRSDGLLDVHYITDEDIRKRTSYASKIGAVTDAARPLPLGGASSGSGAPPSRPTA